MGLIFRHHRVSRSSFFFASALGIRKKETPLA